MSYVIKKDNFYYFSSIGEIILWVEEVKRAVQFNNVEYANNCITRNRLKDCSVIPN
jgi:hypothetical protein